MRPFATAPATPRRCRTDRFLFDEADMAGLTSTTCDRITDFAADRIGLTDIDANTATVDIDDAFTFIGTGAFSNVAGQLRYEQVGGNTLITGDVNGDGRGGLHGPAGWPPHPDRQPLLSVAPPHLPATFRTAGTACGGARHGVSSIS